MPTFRSCCPPLTSDSGRLGNNNTDTAGVSTDPSIVVVASLLPAAEESRSMTVWMPPNEHHVTDEPSTVVFASNSGVDGWDVIVDGVALLLDVNDVRLYIQTALLYFEDPVTTAAFRVVLFVIGLWRSELRTMLLGFLLDRLNALVLKFKGELVTVAPAPARRRTGRSRSRTRSRTPRRS